MGLSDPQYFDADNTGAATYSFSNVNVSNSTSIFIGLYENYARSAAGGQVQEKAVAEGN
jgi:hypothetical protein